MKTTMKAVLALTGLAAGAALADGAAATVCTFESTEGGWSGGTLTAATPAAPANGYAVTDAGHTKVLTVAGSATKSEVRDGIVAVDVLVKVSVPDEAPALPDGSHLAIAVNTAGKLVALAGSSSSDAVSLGDKTYAKDEWVRLTTIFDYANSRCQIAVNGELANGGDWLQIGASKSLTGMTVAGDTAIDDVVIQNAASTVYDKYASVKADGAAATVTSDVEDASGTAVNIPVNYFSVNKIDQSKVNYTISNSSLTYAQAYQAGVAPDEGATFAIEEASYDGNNLTLTFPGDWPAGSYTVKYGATPECDNEANNATATKTGSGNQVTIPLNFESGNVLYYKVTR